LLLLVELLLELLVLGVPVACRWLCGRLRRAKRAALLAFPPEVRVRAHVRA